MVLLESSVFLLGSKLFTTVINDTASKLINVTETAIIHDHKDLHEVLTELDLDMRLSVINSLVNNIKHTGNDAVEICLKSILEVITNINNITDKIKIAQLEHREKYFNGWRAIDLDDYISEIIKQSELLEKRFGLFVNIIKFPDTNEKQD